MGRGVVVCSIQMTPPLPCDDIFHMLMSCAVVNNATSGSGKVLSVARLEMAKYRTKCSK